MKLLYIMTQITENGGVQRVIFDKLNSLIENNSIDLIHLGGNNDVPAFYIDSRIRVHGLSVASSSQSVVKKTINFIKSFVQFKHLLANITPDVIVNANTVLVSWFLPFLSRRIPKIVELHQSYDGVLIFNKDAYGENSLRSKLLMALRNNIYPLYDKVVVLTHTDKKKWGYKNCTVIPNFTNLRPNITISEKDDFNFIWVGRMCHQKGVDILLDVWNRFCKINDRCKLIIVGDGTGKYKEMMEKYLSESYFKNRITYIPQTDDITYYYSLSSVFISTSRFEGLPLVLVEAATIGLPIIGFDITGNDEVIVNGKNGYSVPLYDIDKYVEYMNSLYVNKNVLQSMGNASKEISNSFSKDEIMKKWNDLFKSLSEKKETKS